MKTTNKELKKVIEELDQHNNTIRNKQIEQRINKDLFNFMQELGIPVFSFLSVCNKEIDTLHNQIEVIK